MNIGIYIYKNAEVLDFSGPFEVFSTATRLASKPQLAHTFLVAESIKPIQARGSYSINPHYSIQTHPPIDVLIIVGGIHSQEINKAHVIEWIKQVSHTSQITASVCTGAFLLAKAGVLSKQTVTTHWEDIPSLRQQFPTLTVIENQRWVESDNIITSAGISAGIDMSLYLVSKLWNEDLAIKTARQMEFDWTRLGS